MVDEQIRREIPKVTTEDNQPVEVHSVLNNTAPRDVLKAVRSINICKEMECAGIEIFEIGKGFHSEL